MHLGRSKVPTRMPVMMMMMMTTMMTVMIMMMTVLILMMVMIMMKTLAMVHAGGSLQPWGLEKLYDVAYSNQGGDWNDWARMPQS